MEPQKWRFGRWFSFSILWCLGSMLNFRGVYIYAYGKMGNIHAACTHDIWCVYMWIYAIFFTQLTTTIKQESQYEHNAIAPKALRKKTRQETHLGLLQKTMKITRLVIRCKGAPYPLFLLLPVYQIALIFVPNKKKRKLPSSSVSTIYLRNPETKTGFKKHKKTPQNPTPKPKPWLLDNLQWSHVPSFQASILRINGGRDFQQILENVANVGWKTGRWQKRVSQEVKKTTPKWNATSRII